MALAPGTRLGGYEVLSQIGAGGMGEVYRAKDTKLGRDVALKILPASFTSDPERVARFRREAQVLASLNHPHIGQIYGLEEANGTQFLVLELVDGESLDKRIALGPIPVDEALGIAEQIAEALEAAHEKGIIHRDLKPANIALTKDGQVKVLDFGLAKAVEATNGSSLGAMNSPTITSPAMMTGFGVILGTAAYMSPEQAKGKPADKRSDIWAFGCVLYEMLTGKRAFEGDDVSDTLATVLKGEPDWRALPAELPGPIVLMVRRCLEKDRTKRITDPGTLRFLIADDVTGSSAFASVGAESPVTPPPFWKHATPMTTIAVMVTALFVTIVAWNMRLPSTRPVIRFPVVLPNGQEFAGRSQVIAVSPDGSLIVYAAGAANSQSSDIDAPRQNSQLYSRSLTDMDAHPIAGTNLDVMSPFFSPDGQWIGFYSFQDSTLKKVAAAGGVAVTICKADPPYGVRWEGEWIVFADQGAKGILRVSPNGGEPEVLAATKPGEVFSAPQLIDNGKTVLFTVASTQGADRWDRAQIVVQAVASRDRRIVLRGGSEGRYVPTGHLLYMVGSTLLALPIDRRTWQLRGAPVPIIEGVRRFRTFIGSPGASFAFSSTGTLAYILDSSAAPVTQRTVALATRTGTLEPLGLPPQPYMYPRVSPDGERLAVQTQDDTDTVIWIYDLKGGGRPRRLTFGGQNAYPVWSPDGRSVTFQSNREGDQAIFWQPQDGSRPAERLSRPSALVRHIPEAWRSDGTILTLTASPPFDGRIFTLANDHDHTLKPFSADLHGVQTSFSPDGNWLVYVSTEVGNRAEVFVQPFPSTGAKYQISTEGGRTPLWARDGGQLFYQDRALKLVAVDVHTKPTFSISNRIVLPIDAVFVSGVFGERNYDMLPDGQRFVVITQAEDSSRPTTRSAPSQVNIVFNWFTELQQRVPTR